MFPKCANLTWYLATALQSFWNGVSIVEDPVLVIGEVEGSKTLPVPSLRLPRKTGLVPRKNRSGALILTEPWSREGGKTVPKPYPLLAALFQQCTKSGQAETPSHCLVCE
jgi:hypothetical protein